MKLSGLIFCALLAGFSAPFSTYAKNGDIFDYGQFKFSIDNEDENLVSLYAYSGTEENVSIPASVTYQEKTYSVTAVGWSAFINVKTIRSVAIPETVTSIGGSAFSGCSSLNSITIPESVSTLGWSAFSGCTSLESIDLPDSVTSIPGSAFSGCSSLNSIKLPESVASIGGSAFSGCSSLSSITIPKGITSIGSFAFKDCTSLETVYANSVTPPVCDNYAFFSTPATSVLHVPFDSKEAYQAARGWSVFKNIVDDIDPSATATAIKADIDSPMRVFKVVRDGHILIVKGEKTYTLSGIEM